MRLRRAPAAGRDPSRGDTHRVDDELAILGVTDGMTAPRRRPAAHVRMLAAVHVDVPDAAAFRGEDDLALADDEVNRAESGLMPSAPPPNGPAPHGRATTM